MNAPKDSRDGPRTEEEFQQDLSQLVSSAYERGVDVTGGWDLRYGEEYPDWTVELFRITKRP